jgi:MoaA/NifB/PqqE/SkfB family radical SAM enzyme
MMMPAKKEIFPGVGRECLEIEVTTRCNSSCLHCFARAGISKSATLPVDLAKKIILEGYETGYRHLHISGGEPLLWEGLFEALDCGLDAGYETIFLNTNGTLLTKGSSRRLSGYNGFSMSISLDGPQHLHERIRGKGTHRKALRGIENALAAGIELTVFTTVTKSLLPELPRFADDIYRQYPGIDSIILIQLIRMANGAFGLAEELLEPEDFIRLVRMVALLNIGGRPTLVKKNPLANVVSRGLEMPWIPRVPPLYREGCMVIMADRHMGVVHSGRSSLGRYTPGMIPRVLVSDVYRNTVGPDKVHCPACRYAGLCRENGMIRPPEAYRDVHADELYCRRVLDTILGEKGGDCSGGEKKTRAMERLRRRKSKGGPVTEKVVEHCSGTGVLSDL